MIDELRKLMEFQPVTNNQAVVGKLLDYVEQRLAAAGLTVERMEHSGIQSLYASTSGQKHTKVMLQAHVDVVPGGQKFSQAEDKLYGRGCYDMLFAVASYLQLIDSLDDIHKYDLSILLTGDEEFGGRDGVGKIMQLPDYSCDVCILPDAGEGIGTLSVGAKGLWQLKLQAEGRPHHASRPWDGDNAASKLVSFLDELSSVFDGGDKEASTLTIAQLQAGETILNQGPGVATAGLDIRFSDSDDLVRIAEALEALRQTFDIKITWQQTANAYAIDNTHPLIVRFIENYVKAIGRDITTHRSYGSSDARFFADKGIPVIMFRPDGGGAHGDDEWLSVSSWEQFQGLLSSYVVATAANDSLAAI